MEKQDLESLKKLINEYGPADAVELFYQAMRECADEYSDLGLKEQAQKAADVLDYLNDASD